MMSWLDGWIASAYTGSTASSLIERVIHVGFELGDDHLGWHLKQHSVAVQVDRVAQHYPHPDLAEAYDVLWIDEPQRLPSDVFWDASEVVWTQPQLSNAGWGRDHLLIAIQRSIDVGARLTLVWPTLDPSGEIDRASAIEAMRRNFTCIEASDALMMTWRKPSFQQSMRPRAISSSSGGEPKIA
ncbi:MAG: hypothetical protein AAF539_13840 [Planctomycetota bacterium]